MGHPGEFKRVIDRNPLTLMYQWFADCGSFHTLKTHAMRKPQISRASQIFFDLTNNE